MHEGYRPGDLLRMCTITDAHSKHPELINWLYGIYIDTVEEIHIYDGFTDCTQQYDRILYNGTVLKADDYWHLERIS